MLLHNVVKYMLHNSLYKHCFIYQFFYKNAVYGFDALCVKYKVAVKYKAQ